MPKFHCVLDTSALLKKYRPEAGSDNIKALFNRDDCALHILNVTIPEVTGAFVRWQLDGELKKEDRKELLGYFIGDINQYKVVIHNITHRNVVKTDDVWDYSILVSEPKPFATNIDRQITCPNCKYLFTQSFECPKCKHLFTEKIVNYKARVGPIDVLVISVCNELKTAYGQAHLFSSDEHLLRVAKKLGIKAHDPEKLNRLPFR